MNTAAGAESAKLTCVSLENSASPCFGAKNQNLRQALIHKEYPYHPGKCLQQVIHNVAMLWRKNLQESMHSLELMKPTLIIPIPPSHTLFIVMAMVPPTHVALVAVLLPRFEAAAMGSQARNLKGIIKKERIPKVTP